MVQALTFYIYSRDGGEKNFIRQFSSSAELTGYMFRYESLCILHGVFRDQNYYDNVTKSWSCVLITQHTRNVACSNKNDLLWEN